MATHNTSSFELKYVIRGMKFKLDFEEGCFDEGEKKEICEFVEHMSSEMHIDSSYVDRVGSKYKSTFMLDEGWKSLRDIILDSQCCKYLHPNYQETIADAFCSMGRCYMYECLAMKYDFSHIQVDIDPCCEFDVSFVKDTSNAWKMYTGKWQTWKDDVWTSKPLSTDSAK